eukprot:COSAG04_NODE_648_length_11585_cov_20.935335_4_plen_254_part_00
MCMHMQRLRSERALVPTGRPLRYCWPRRCAERVVLRLERLGGGKRGRRNSAGYVPAPRDGYDRHRQPGGPAEQDPRTRGRVHTCTSNSRKQARVDLGAARRWKGARAAQRVDRRRSYAPPGPGWKIQEVSRAGAQSVTSKSKLLAREMPRVCSRGLRVDPGAARSRKCVWAGQRVDRRRSYASSGPGWKIQEVSRVGAQSVTSKSKLLAREMPRVCSRGSSRSWIFLGWLSRLALAVIPGRVPAATFAAAEPL